MQPSTVRTFLITAFALNLVFLALVLFDYTRWDGDNAVPLFVAWGVLIVVALLIGLFARTEPPRTVERAVERTPQPELEFRLVQAKAPPVPAAKAGPFQFNGYTLYGRTVQLKGEGRERTIYFFAKKVPKSGHAIPKPDGFHVGVNERTGLPFLKRGTGRDGEDLTPNAEPEPRPQCAALTEDGQQCRNSARADSRYCISHKGYQPPTAKGIVLRADTASKVATKDTLPSVAGGNGARLTEKGAQCQALTADGAQCKNSTAAGTNYCAAHKGYRAPTTAAVVASKDTRPRSRRAQDTAIAVRKPARRRR